MDSLDLTSQDWLPAAAGLTEATSRSLLQSIQSIDLSTSASAQPIGTRFAYRGAGGKAIVMLHGFDSSCLEFRRLVPELAVDHRLWALDMLGFGFGDRPADLQVSPAKICEHLYAFWQSQVKEPMVLLGASMGGAAAIEFALSHPEAVEKLVLLDSAGLTRGPNLSKVLIKPLGNLATGFLRRPDVRIKVSQKAYQDQSLVTEDANLCASLHLLMPNWSEALITFTRSGGYYVGDRITQVAVPTLILWGRQDRILGTKDAARFEAAIALSRLQWIEDCGHVPHLEKAQETAGAIAAFVA
ncbi:MAG: alpha/beta hydrolase [Alkalinema sp. RU_4_3]|nr:alpha/beta hydrolase [Alkalinema sp. RU_4_3]